MPFLMWQELLYWSRKITLRSFKERVIQTSSFELVGIFLLPPFMPNWPGHQWYMGLQQLPYYL